MKISKQRKNDRKLFNTDNKSKLFVCCNCKRETPHGHFCPPSLGEEGFWACESFNKVGS